MSCWINTRVLWNVQLLDHLRTNRANLKPPQLQMLEQLENQFSLMQQHQQQVHVRNLGCKSFDGPVGCNCYCRMQVYITWVYISHYCSVFGIISPVCQMKQQAAAGGQPRPSLQNGSSAEPSHHHAGLSRTSPLNQTAIQPPCVTQPTANGSCSSSPSARLPGHQDKNHTLGLGGGGVSNGNVPYPQNSLPHNCTAASHPSTSSTTSSPSHADETWKSQQRNTTTQVCLKIISLFCCFKCFLWSLVYVMNDV